MTSESSTETRKVRTALTAYRVMAWTTGIWLIALCVEVVLHYVLHNEIRWVGVVHGWVYFVYLLATLNLAVKVRWPLWTTVGTLLAGTIPLLGIILEHFRTRQVKQQFNLEAPQALAAPEAKASAPDPDARSRPSARE
jgi:integral membrane protein